MNYPSEWKRYYEPRRGKFMYKHKGTGVISDTLINFAKKTVKPLTKLVFKTASQGIAKNVGEKVAEVATKRGSDKIQELLRKRKTKPKVSQKSLQQLNNLISQNPKKTKVSQKSKVSQSSMQKLNNLISNL